MAARISLLAACAVGLSVAMASLAAYVTLRAQLHERLDDSLLNRASRGGQDPARHARDLAEHLADRAGRRLTCGSTSSTPTARCSRDKASNWVTRPTADEIAVAQRHTSSHTLRTINATAVRRPRRDRPGRSRAPRLMFVQSSEPIERTLDRMGLVLLLVGIGGIVAAGIIGLAVARSALLPVRRLSAAAEHIARTDELDPDRGHR